MPLLLHDFTQTNLACYNYLLVLYAKLENQTSRFDFSFIYQSTNDNKLRQLLSVSCGRLVVTSWPTWLLGQFPQACNCQAVCQALLSLQDLSGWFLAYSESEHHSHHHSLIKRKSYGNS